MLPVGESVRDSQIPGNVEWCVKRHEKSVRFETGVAEVVRLSPATLFGPNSYESGYRSY
jgi:hypothetical protein